jgi:hypothetical protein
LLHGLLICLLHAQPFRAGFPLRVLLLVLFSILILLFNVFSACSSKCFIMFRFSGTMQVLSSYCLLCFLTCPHLYLEIGVFPRSVSVFLSFSLPSRTGCYPMGYASTMDSTRFVMFRHRGSMLYANSMLRLFVGFLRQRRVCKFACRVGEWRLPARHCILLAASVVASTVGV